VQAFISFENNITTEDIKVKKNFHNVDNNRQLGL